jgi:hypothetical protein
MPSLIEALLAVMDQRRAVAAEAHADAGTREVPLPLVSTRYVLL